MTSIEIKTKFNKKLSEYTVNPFINGKLDEKSIYYTDCIDDARETKKAMEKSLNDRYNNSVCLSVNADKKIHDLDKTKESFICDTLVIDSIDFIENNSDNTFTVYFKIKKRINNVNSIKYRSSNIIQFQGKFISIS